MITPFEERSVQALGDKNLRVALDRATTQLQARRQQAFSSLEDAELTRDRARHAKLKIIDNLGDNLLKFEKRLQENGVHVHWAAKGEDANAKVFES